MEDVKRIGQDSSSTLKLEGYKDAIVYVLHTFCVWAVNQNKQASVGPKHCEWLEIPWSVMWAAVPPDIRGYVKKVIKGSLHGFFLLHPLRAFDEQNPIFFYFDNFQTPTQAEES